MLSKLLFAKLLFILNSYSRETDYMYRISSNEREGIFIAKNSKCSDVERDIKKNNELKNV